MDQPPIPPRGHDNNTRPHRATESVKQESGAVEDGNGTRLLELNTVRNPEAGARPNARAISPLAQLLYQRPPQVGTGEITKLLLNVTVMDSTGPLRVLVSTNATATAVIRQALEAYDREGRKPTLGRETASFELYGIHNLSQPLRPDVTIREAGVRQFMVRKRKAMQEGGEGKKGSLWLETLTSVATLFSSPHRFKKEEHASIMALLCM